MAKITGDNAIFKSLGGTSTPQDIPAPATITSGAVTAGGKPSQGTPKDKRKKENN
jgi:hypothetical protein